MKNKFSCSTGIKISLTIFGVIVLLFITNIICYKTSFKEYTNGLVTELCGIIITILFVQRLFDKKKTEDEKLEEMNAIKRFNKVLSKYIDKYIIYFNCVTIPIEQRNNISDSAFNDNFEVSDMYDLHYPSLIIKDDINKSSVEMFFEYELTIRNYMINLLNCIDFNFNTEIENLFLEYIDISAKYDPRGQILATGNKIKSKETDANYISNFIKESGTKFYNDFVNDVHQEANLLHSYIFLYLMMNKESEIIKSYLKLLTS